MEPTPEAENRKKRNQALEEGRQDQKVEGKIVPKDPSELHINPVILNQ